MITFPIWNYAMSSTIAHTALDFLLAEPGITQAVFDGER
jgi:hypothetical protein